MIRIARPSEALIARWLADREECPWSYPDVGASRGAAPAGYTVAHHRVALGEGARAFRRATEAMHRWAMFQLGWIEIFPPAARIREGTTVAVVAHHFGMWSLNACRIVYVVDERADVDRFGFAYGTLTDHAVQGEERFTVEWRHADDVVTYDLFAFSRPGGILTSIGRPLVRRLQRRFARDSLRAMQHAV